MAVPNVRARVGTIDPWRQVVIVRGSGSTTEPFTVTPTSGKLQIIYFDDAGVQKWWDGNNFVGTETTLATTINGNASEYTYVHQAETVGKNVLFRGWIGAAGNLPDENTVQEVVVEVVGDPVRLRS